MIASDTASLVKQAVDIVDVVGQSVPLRRAGSRHVGLCPFHHEKTPSFYVDARSQLFHCFGCGSGGDVLTFVMKHQNLPFSEAVQYLADRYHIPLPKRDQPGSSGAKSAEAAHREREMLYGVMERATDFYYRQLREQPAGGMVGEYLKRRGIPDRVVEEERLGYAPASWDALSRHLTASGVAPEVGLRAGLLARSSRDEGRVYDRFRNRLVFPIRDERKRVVAFGGRILGSEHRDEPKYLNSPESPIFQKGRLLYQLARAREACREVRQVFLVEGYMDLLAFHVQGCYRVVATLGTALTPSQIRLLSRHVEEVVLAYDGDEAGERAMLRTLPLFLQEGVAVSCVRFPDGMDPDDFLRQRGWPAFEELVRERQDLGTYSLLKVLARWDGTAAGKANVIQELQPILMNTRSTVLRAEYLRLISDRLSVSEKVIQRHLHQLKGGGGKPASPLQPVPAAFEQSHSLEEKIVRVMIQYPDTMELVRASGVLPAFQDSPLKDLAQALLNLQPPPTEGFAAATVFDRLEDGALRGLFTHLRLDPLELAEPVLHLKDWVKALQERARRQRNLELTEALRRAERAGDQEQVRTLLAQIHQLTVVRKKTEQAIMET